MIPMMTLLPTDISRPSEGLVPCLISGAERVLIDTSAKAVRNMEYAVRLQGAGSYVWAWLECSGEIFRNGKAYQIWYITRTGIGIDRSVIAEYVLEPGTDMDDFMIVVRNAIAQYIDGANTWRGQCRWLYSV